MTHAHGLPPAYIKVGELDIFRDESIRYAANFVSAGVSAELHVLPGCPHAFDVFAPDSEVAKRAYEGRIRALLRL